MPKKILVVDDEKEIVNLLEIALKAKGYDVISIGHGNTLFEIVTSEKPDLVLLDILLPGVDGYSLQLQFAGQEETKDIPVIILTSLPAAKTLFDEFEQVRFFVTKPFEITDLLGKIGEILGE